MKRLFYFHGLQSKQGGEKVDYLTRSFLVYAPQMKYKEPITWEKIPQLVAKQKPDLIIGSSMGGLMGFRSAYNLDCKMLLFNPAIDRIPEYIDGWECKGEEQKAYIQVVLGKNDTEVSPKKTLEYFENYKIKANVTMLDIEHRILYEVFTQEIQRFINKF